MTVDEHIKELIAQSKNDLGASNALAMAGYYAHSLFFAHLVLEKLCKALWMKHKQVKDYPYTHNLIKLITDANVTITEMQMQFYADMNIFQTKGRYQETIVAIENSMTLDKYNIYNALFKIEIEWLINQLQ